MIKSLLSTLIVNEEYSVIGILYLLASTLVYYFSMDFNNRMLMKIYIEDQNNYYKHRCIIGK